jgi:hypothetical protein
MKNFFYLFLVFVLASCSNSKLPEQFIGKYVNDANSREIITIENANGEFIEQNRDGSIVKGKMILEDISGEAGETFIRITGIEITEYNSSSNVHMLGVMDYDKCYNAFRIDNNKKPYINLPCPTYGGFGQTYTLNN